MAAAAGEAAARSEAEAANAKAEAAEAKCAQLEKEADGLALDVASLQVGLSGEIQDAKNTLISRMIQVCGHLTFCLPP